MAGAPKCGTTALYAYLSQHPDIYMSERKEPQYFGKDFKKRPLNSYKHIADDATYLSLFKTAKDEKYIGEASTSYFFSTTAAQEIRAFNPDAKVIIMLRDPVQMMYSLYYQQLETGTEDLPSFEEALAAEPARRRGESLTRLTYIPESVCYRYIAQYSQHVARYQDVFGDKLHIILFDDFRNDTKQSYEAVLKFLGVETDNRIDFAIHNPNSQPRSTKMRDFLRNPPEVLLNVGKVALPVVRPIYRWLTRLNTQAGPRPPLNPATQALLCAEFRSEVDALSRLIGRDLGHWCQSSES